MPKKRENCSYCVGYAEWDPVKDLGIFPGLECRGTDACPLWRKYGQRHSVTQRSNEELVREAVKIDERLGVLND